MHIYNARHAIASHKKQEKSAGCAMKMTRIADASTVQAPCVLRHFLCLVFLVQIAVDDAPHGADASHVIPRSSNSSLFYVYSLEYY